jgi:hypothetical protein
MCPGPSSVKLAHLHWPLVHRGCFYEVDFLKLIEENPIVIMVPFETSDLFTYTGGAGGILVGLRFLFKLLQKDLVDLKTSSESNVVLKNWKDIAEEFRRTSRENAERADLFAEQRNKAIEELGTLKGEVIGLTAQIVRLEENLTRMEITLTEMEARLANTQCPVCSANHHTG